MGNASNQEVQTFEEHGGLRYQGKTNATRRGESRRATQGSPLRNDARKTHPSRKALRMGHPAKLKNRGEILRRFEQQAPQDDKLLGRSG